MNDQPNDELKQFENGTPPDNNLVWAILSIICCLPLGIVAIISATKVNTLWAEGHMMQQDKRLKMQKNMQFGD